MLKILQVLTALFALIATQVQAYQSAKQIKMLIPAAIEVSWQSMNWPRSFGHREIPSGGRADNAKWRLKQESPSEA